MPTELQRIEALEREVSDLRAKVTSIESDLALVPGLITTGFRQISSQMATFRAHVDQRFAHVDERFDATVRAVAEIVKEGKQ